MNKFKPGQDHYFMLSNTIDVDFFSENSPGSFRNQIPAFDQSSQEYEVGLVNAEFHLDPSALVEEKYFKTEADRTLQSMKSTYTKIDIEKVEATSDTPGVIRFMTVYNLEIEKLRKDVSLVLETDGKTLSFENLIADRDVKISPNFQLAFGFSMDTFKTGITLATRPFDEKAYEAIPAEDTMTTEIYRVDYVDTRVDDLEQPDVIYLISNINKALEEVEIECEYTGTSLLVECVVPYSGIKFSQLICDTFGINNEWYQGKREITNVRSSVVLVRPRNTILVDTDLVAPQFAIGGFKRFLYATRIPEKEHLQIVPSPILYFPTVKDVGIHVIDISLSYDNGKSVPMQPDSTSTVFLHLRPKTY